jgi:hypothetical protein
MAELHQAVLEVVAVVAIAMLASAEPLIPHNQPHRGNCRWCNALGYQLSLRFALRREAADKYNRRLSCELPHLRP